MVAGGGLGGLLNSALKIPGTSHDTVDSGNASGSGGASSQDSGDPAGGAIDQAGAGDEVAPAEQDTTTQKCQATFTRSFMHYAKPIESSLSWAVNNATISGGWQYIPYDRLASAMTSAAFQTVFLPSKRFRISTMGFKIHHLIPIQEELTNLGGQVVETTTFNERPFLMCYADTDRAVYPISRAAVELDPDVLPNVNMSHHFPRTRVDGTLPEIKQIRLIPEELKNEATTDDQLIAVMNTGNWSCIIPGQEWGYDWVNKSSTWHPTTLVDCPGNDLNSKPFNIGTNTLPKDFSAEWTPDYYSSQFQYDAEQPSASYNANNFERLPRGHKIMTNVPYLANDPPPICQVKMPEIRKSNNELMQMSMSFMCTYTCTIEWEPIIPGPQAMSWLASWAAMNSPYQHSRKATLQKCNIHKLVLPYWPRNERMVNWRATEILTR